MSRPVKWQLAGPVFLAGMIAVSAAGCTQPAPATEKKAAEVVVTTPVMGEVTDYQDFTGRLDGIKTVEIRARVSGFVMSAPFKEGDLVREGDLLFEIDPQPYRADFNLAEANYKVAKADQNLQEKVAARARALIAARASSQEDYDTAVATSEKSRATVEATGAARDRAKLYLDYTRVISPPLGGRISRRFVDPGNLVTADTTLLTTIVNDNQLFAYFDVDERTYMSLVGQKSTSPGSSLVDGLQFPVLMQLANEDQFSRTGTINFVDNRVNASTGTIRMRAVFDNDKGLLRAGLFVRIRLPIGSPYQALLIPGEALMSDQGRHYVYVVGDKNEVVYRSVTLGQEVPVKVDQEIHGLRVIKEGVTAGERVIVSGMQRVRPKAEVQASMQDPPKPPESLLGRLLGAKMPAQNAGPEKDKATR